MFFQLLSWSCLHFVELGVFSVINPSVNPLTAAAAAAATGQSWERDGLNLRLQIGICSVDDDADDDDYDENGDASVLADHDLGDGFDYSSAAVAALATPAAGATAIADEPTNKRQRLMRGSVAAKQQQQQQQPSKPIIRVSLSMTGYSSRLDIIAASSVAAGHEIYNTYGEHSNAELLHKYGFCLRQNPFDEVTVSNEGVIAAAKSVMSDHVGVRARCKWMRRHR